MYLKFSFYNNKKKPHNLQVKEIIKRSTINLIIAIASIVVMCVCCASECLCVCKWLQDVYSYVIVYTNITVDWPDFSFFLSLSLFLPALRASILTTFLFAFFSSLSLCERLWWCYMHMYGHVLLRIKNCCCALIKLNWFFFFHSDKKNTHKQGLSKWIIG